jgi:hypothetical protein
MALGAVVLLDILLRSRDLQAFYGDQGVLSRSLYFQQSWEWWVYHLFLASGTTGGLLVLFAVWAAAATCLMVGYQTRWAGLITWYFVASIQLRNPLVMDGGDDLLRLLLFWTPFLPLSARWSVDARRHPEWAALPNAYRSLATLGVTFQIFVLYFFAAHLKTGDDWWKTRDALYYALSIDQFATGLGRWLTAYPDLLRLLTSGALILEYGLALLVLFGARWLSARAVFFVLAVSFHLLIACTLHFGIFMLIVICGLMAFFPSAWLDRLSPPETPASQPAGALPAGYRLSRPTQAFCAGIVVMIGIFNHYSIDHVQRIPPWSRWVMDLTFEQQHWHFFAPYPFKEEGWFVLEVTLADGAVVDGWDNGNTMDGKPVSVASRFPNQRWRRWLQNLTQIPLPDRESWRQSTLRYAAYQWMKQHPEARPQRFRLVLMEEINVPPGQQPSVQPVVLAQMAPPRMFARPSPSSGSGQGGHGLAKPGEVP